MTTENSPTNLRNTSESLTPLLDKVSFDQSNRGLIERSVGYDGALVLQAQGREGLEAHRINLVLKLAGFIGKEALDRVDFGEHAAESRDQKLDLIVDELIESQTSPSILSEANTILRETNQELTAKNIELENQVSPDIQFLYNELERLQNAVRAKDAQIKTLTGQLDEGILKLADKDLQIENIQKQPSAIESVSQAVAPVDVVLAIDAPHDIKSEMKHITGGIKILSSRVAHVIGVR